MDEKSLRFEVKPDDCRYSKNWNDCKKDRERHDLRGNNHKGENCYAWSIFLTTNFQNIFPTKLSVFQFKQEKNDKPIWIFQNHYSGFHINN